MARSAFRFYGCIELREILGHRARDERELMEILEQVPSGSVYYHTHSVVLRHYQVTGAYPNDFANWVASQVRDQVLAERLAVVDPFEFEDLERLREALITIIDDHISDLNPVPRVVFGEPFFFVQSHVVEVPLGLEARTLEEFITCLREIDESSIYLHTLEARVRRGIRGGDFGEWLSRELGLTSLSEEIARINPYLGGLERIRTELLRLTEAAMAQGAHDHGG
ncbi:MAG TPA: DUF5752 family protein [Methylomirabilota bacterium]|nr:DUF5752 family protein [Methylomirabilota bacterium]